MKKVMLMLTTVIMCSISAWSQSPAIVGIAVSQCNDFSYSKKMLINDGYVYNTQSSTEDCAVYEYSGAQYVNEAIIVKIYKLGNNKVEKCVIYIRR